MAKEIPVYLQKKAESAPFYARRHKKLTLNGMEIGQAFGLPFTSFRSPDVFPIGFRLESYWNFQYKFNRQI